MFYHCGQHLDYDICLLLMGFHVVLFDSEGCHLRWPTGLIKLWNAWLWFRWSSTGTFNHSQIKQPSVVQPQSKHGVWDLWDKGFRWYPYKYSTLFHNIPIINAIVCPFHPNHLHIFRWVSPPSSKNPALDGPSVLSALFIRRSTESSSQVSERFFRTLQKNFPSARWSLEIPPQFPEKKRCLSGESPRIVIQCALTSWKTGHTHGKKGNVLLGNMFWGSFGTMQPSASLNQPTNQPTTQPPNHPDTLEKI